MRRLLLFVAGLVAALMQPAAGASVNATVLLVTDVSDTADYMPRPLWRKLATQYVNARTVTGEDGTALPDDARCRSGRALYAVLATFERAPQLPGVTRDPARGYGIARFTVRDCVTGTVSPAKALALVSDPLSEAYRGDFSPNAEEIWDRPIRVATERDPLGLPAVARIVRVEGGVALIETAGGGFSENQVLRVFADANAKPYAEPIELVVLEVSGKYARAEIVGKQRPRAGDYLDVRRSP